MHVHSTVYFLHTSTASVSGLSNNLTIRLSVTDTASSTSADPPAFLRPHD
jgi:hypothetical protein